MVLDRLCYHFTPYKYCNIHTIGVIMVSAANKNEEYLATSRSKSKFLLSAYLKTPKLIPKNIQNSNSIIRVSGTFLSHILEFKMFSIYKRLISYSYAVLR